MHPHDPAATISDASPSREELEQYLAQAIRHYANCDFTGADLSRLDLQSCTFERCVSVSYTHLTLPTSDLV